MPLENKRNERTWDLTPIIDWLFKEGRMLASADELTRQLGNRLLEQGAPLWRLRMSVRTLHPLLSATTSEWERDNSAIEPVSVAHGIESRPAYVGSPFKTIATTRAPFRKRICDGLTSDDHTALHELQERGATDYLGLPMLFSNNAVAIVVFNTDTEGGYTDDDIIQFERLSAFLAPIIEVYSARNVSHAVAHAYLGQRTGQRVLDGQITRGHIENINAAILISDIRNWTGLNNNVSSEKALSLANDYFEVIADAVAGNGGEILKFLGDGVLAIFPFESDQGDSGCVCDNALNAARQAMQLARQSEPPLALEFGIGMHFGEVLYGNIGAATRIDFTVMGQAVNTAARIESLCGKMDRAILFSEEFAERLSESSTLIVEKRLKGYDTKIKVMTTDTDYNAGA